MLAFQRPCWELCYSPFILVLKGDCGALICRYLNLANETVLHVWVWSLSLKPQFLNRIIQAETLCDALVVIKPTEAAVHRYDRNASGWVLIGLFFHPALRQITCFQLYKEEHWFLSSDGEIKTTIKSYWDLWPLSDSRPDEKGACLKHWC